MANVTYERVNWEDSPSQNTPINQTNLNKMDKGIADCAAAVNECFQSASNGKALIASAITGKGVTTASDATYAVMAGNIEDYLVYPQGTKNISSNGEQDVTNYENVSVNVGLTYQGTQFAGATSANDNINYDNSFNFTFEKGKTYILIIITGNSWDSTTNFLNWNISSTNTNGWTVLENVEHIIRRGRSHEYIALIKPEVTYTATVRVYGSASAYYSDIHTHAICVKAG